MYIFSDVGGSLISFDATNGFLGKGQFGLKFEAKLYLKALSPNGLYQIDRFNPMVGVVEQIDKRIFSIDFQVIESIHPNILTPPTIHVESEYL
jgi:hypothetical protein